MTLKEKIEQSVINQTILEKITTDESHVYLHENITETKQIERIQTDADRRAVLIVYHILDSPLS